MRLKPKLTARKAVIQFLRAALLATIATIVMILVPSPYVIRAPGRAEPVGPKVEIRGVKTYQSFGQFYLTTIIYERASLLTCLYAMMDTSAELIPADVAGPAEQMQAPGDWDMARSQYSAKVAALRYLGYKTEMEASGVRVLQMMPESPAVGKVEPGDLISAADGQSVRTVEELQAAVRASRPGKAMRLGIERNGSRLEVRVVPALIKGRRLLGLQIQTELAPRPLPVQIEIRSGDIVGSSAGLMFSLEIVDRLAPQDLTAGRRVAGTGTIEPNGQVGSVLGVRFKVVAAARAGATLFLVPEEDLEEARSAGTSLTLVPVGSLGEAVQKLQETR